MLTINLRSRMKNEAFWLGIISWIILIAQLCGFDATTIIPKNYTNILNALFGFLGFLGVAVDTSTPGVSDQILANQTVQVVNQAAETKEKVQAEGSTTAINSEVSENSQDNLIPDGSEETTIKTLNIPK